MKLPVERAKGKVLTFGLGLGYFAYMCSLKEEVESVTVVEKDKSVIKLFNEIILPLRQIFFLQKQIQIKIAGKKQLDGFGLTHSAIAYLFHLMYVY